VTLPFLCSSPSDQAILKYVTKIDMTSTYHETGKHPRHRLTDVFVVNQEAVFKFWILV
jgi:hypothetical protein